MQDLRLRHKTPTMDFKKTVNNLGANKNEYALIESEETASSASPDPLLRNVGPDAATSEDALEIVVVAEAVPPVASSLFVELPAPADLPADYELTVQLPDGTSTTVVVVSDHFPAVGCSCGKRDSSSTSDTPP